MRKTLIKIVAIPVLIFAIIGAVLLFSFTLKEYEIKEKYSFSETANVFFALDEIEKANINSKLISEISQNDYIFDFKPDGISADLYFDSSDISNKENDLIASKPLFEEDIDVVKTVYGVMLAKNTGFEIDKQKLQNYINQNYNKINNMKNTADILNTLYYTIILDELNNNYIIDKDRKYIQNIIDKTLRLIDFTDDISNDIVIARKALEIVIDLQLHDVKVHINTNQISKIRKGIQRAVTNPNIINSIIITDIFIIDDIIDTGILNEDLFVSVYKTLTADGGSKTTVANGDDTSDIYATYRFFICFDRMNNYSNLPAQVEYTKSLQLSDGIYRNSLQDNPQAGLEAILYGNSISKLVISN